MNNQCAIAILNYNNSGQLVRAVKSAHKYAPGFPLLIWDNNSKDSSVAEAEKAAPDAMIIASPVNLWFSGGSNAAVAACDTPFVFLMNADVFFEEADVLEKMVDYMKKHPDLIALTPAIRDNGVIRHQAHNAITPLMCIARDTFIGGLLRRTDWYQRMNHADRKPDEIFRSEKVTNCCCLIRREAFLKVGGFDFRLILYWTEEEFGRKSACLKYEQAVFGSSIVTHQHGGSTGSVDRLLVRAVYVCDRLTYMRCNFGVLSMLWVELLMLLRPGFWNTIKDYYGVFHYRRLVRAARGDAARWQAVLEMVG